MDNNPHESGGRHSHYWRKITRRFRSLNKQHRQLVILGFMVVGVLVTVAAASQVQNLRGLASGDAIACSDVPGEDIEMMNFLDTSDSSSSGRTEIKNQTEEIRSYVKNNHPQSKEEAMTRKEKLKAMLDARKQSLKALMRKDPQSAYEYIKNEPKAKEEVEVPTENCLEEPVTLEGELQIIHADFLNGTKDLVTLVDESEKRYYLHVPDKNATNIDAENVSVTGYKVGNDVLVDTSVKENFKKISQSLNFLEKAVQKVYAAYPTPIGVKKVAVILTDSAVTRTQVATHFTDTINTYFKQASYNKMSLSVSVYGPVAVDTSCTARPWKDSAAAAKTSAGVSEDNFDNVVVLGTFSGCSWAGIAFMPGKLSAVRGGSALAMTPAHEMGHNYGAHHASIDINQDGQIGGTSDSSFNTGEEYNDVYTTMGRSGNKGLYNAPHAEKMGWLVAPELQTVTSSGNYTIGVTGSTVSGVKALKIPRTNAQPLYIEYRQPVGYDANLQNIANTNVYSGALFHTSIPSYYNVRSVLIDVNPPPVPAQSVLLVGQTFVDPVSTISFKTLSRTSTSITVQILMPGQPVLSITPVNSPTPTRALTLTPTRTPTPKSKRRVTPTPTRILTPTPTKVPSATPTRTPTPTASATSFSVMSYTNPPTGLASLSGYSSLRTGFKAINAMKVSRIGCYGCGVGSRLVLYNSNSSFAFGTIIFDKTTSGTSSSWSYVDLTAVPLSAGSYYVLRVDPTLSPNYYGTTQKNYTDISFLSYSTYSAPTWKTGSFALQVNYTK